MEDLLDIGSDLICLFSRSIVFFIALSWSNGHTGSGRDDPRDAHADSGNVKRA